MESKVRYKPRKPDFLYPPARATRAAIEEFERRQEAGTRLVWDIPKLDDYLIPMMPGDLISIVGRPGHGKTSCLIHLARAAARQLKDDEGAYVIYATWETLVEEFIGILTSGESGQSLADIGRGKANLDSIRSAMAGIISSRVAVVGRSMETPSGHFHTLDDLDAVLSRLRQEGKRPALILVDYLQRIRGKPGIDRSKQVTENLEVCKDIALSHRAPLALAAQSRRDVDDYSGLRIPSLNDAQWSSSVEQTSDKVLGVTRPSLYLEEGSTIKQGGVTYGVGTETFCLKVLKQRWAEAGETFVLGFDPKIARLYQIEGAAEGEMPF